MEIEHQAQHDRFIHRCGDQISVLEYTLTGGHIDFAHTFVPVQLRGRGIAERLVRYGLGWARDQGFVINASCWYVRRFLRHGTGC